MWHCLGCGEEIEDTFDACWKCGTARDGAVPSDFHREPDDPAVPDPGPGTERTEDIVAGLEADPVEELVTIAAYDLPSLAEVDRVFLEQEGISAFLADDNLVTMNWLLANAVGGAKLLVAASEAGRAAELLAQCRAQQSQAQLDRPQTDVTFPCEECAGNMTFPAEYRGRVEVCPHCSQYVDVPE
jgi:hypothetical protein